jgi:hypothetical protein
LLVGGTALWANARFAASAAKMPAAMSFDFMCFPLPDRSAVADKTIKEL